MSDDDNGGRSVGVLAQIRGLQEEGEKRRKGLANRFDEKIMKELEGRVRAERVEGAVEKVEGGGVGGVWKGRYVDWNDIGRLSLGLGYRLIGVTLVPADNNRGRL